MKNKLFSGVLQTSEQENVKGGHTGWSYQDGCEYEYFWDPQAQCYNYTGNYRCYAIIKPRDSFDNNIANFESFSISQGIQNWEEMKEHFFNAENSTNVY